MKWYLVNKSWEFTNWEPRQFARHIPNVSFPKDEPSASISGAGWKLVPLTDAPPTLTSTTTVDTRTISVSGDTATANYTTRNKTSQELADELAAKRAGMEVSMRQARLALLQEGLLSSVDTVIAGLTEPDKTNITIEWEYASNVDRNSPWMGQMATALGLSDTQLDSLFELAETL